MGGTSFGSAAEEASTGEMEKMGLGATEVSEAAAGAVEEEGTGSWGSGGLVSGL